MKLRVQFSWREAFASRYSDKTLKELGVTFRKRKLEVFLPKTVGCEKEKVKEIQQWLVENDVSDYEIFGVFAKDYLMTHFEGISFVFECPTVTTLFKLRYE